MPDYLKICDISARYTMLPAGEGLGNPCKQWISVSPYKPAQYCLIYLSTVPGRLPPQLSHQLKMIQQMSLAGQIDTFHAFFGNLYVKSDKRGIISGSQTGYFPYNTAGRLLLATDARHKLFMTNSQTNTHHNLILYFLFHSQGNLLQCKFTELQDILGLKEIIECSLYFSGLYIFPALSLVISSSAVRSIFTTSSAS